MKTPDARAVAERLEKWERDVLLKVAQIDDEYKSDGGMLTPFGRAVAAALREMEQGDGRMIQAVAGMGCAVCRRWVCSCTTIPNVMPAPYTPPPRGCICPPGANLECQAPMCPRKPLPTGAIGSTP